MLLKIAQEQPFLFGNTSHDASRGGTHSAASLCTESADLLSVGHLVVSLVRTIAKSIGRLKLAS